MSYEASYSFLYEIELQISFEGFFVILIAFWVILDLQFHLKHSLKFERHCSTISRCSY